MKTFVWGCVGICFVLAWGYVSSLHVDIVRVDIENAMLSKALHGKTVVHLSDIHMDSWGYREKRMMTLLDQLHPDLILLTGDFIPWRGDVDAALDFLSRLSAPMGVYAVLGDYDTSNSRNSCLFCHQKNSGRLTEVHKIQMLRNNAVCLDNPEGDLCIYGLDGGMPLINFDAIQKGNPLIVLTHDPLKFNALDGSLGCVVLAGDTHGGQIYLPSWLWHVIGYEKNAQYNAGVFTKGANTLMVTRGVGTSHLPFRLFCPPEILSLTFISPEEQ